MGKRGVLSTPKIDLSIHHDARSIIVPGMAGKRATVSIEDEQLAISGESFASSVLSAIDKNADSTELTMIILMIVLKMHRFMIAMNRKMLPQ